MSKGLVACLREDKSVKSFNERRKEMTPSDIEKALCGEDFSGMNLSGINLKGLTLRGLKLNGANCHGAQFERSKFVDIEAQGTDFTGAYFDQCVMKESQLQTANFIGSEGLLEEAVAGCNLAGATLPDFSFAGRENVAEICKTARNYWFLLLGSLIVAFVGAMHLEDAFILTNRGTQLLPFLNLKVPPWTFFTLAPIFFLCFYSFFHLTLYRLWEELGKLPAIFPDGNDIEHSTYPSLLVSVTRRRFSCLRDRSGPLKDIYKARYCLMIFLVWLLTPIAMFFSYYPILKCQNEYDLIIPMIALSFCIGIGHKSFNIAMRCFPRLERGGAVHRWLVSDTSVLSSSVVIGLISLFVFLLISLLLVPKDVDSKYYLHFSVAELEIAKKRSKYDNATTVEEKNAQVGNLDLSDRSLVSLEAEDSFLFGASLRNCRLDGAKLARCNLTMAKLQKGSFAGVDLTSAILAHTELDDADFSKALGVDKGVTQRGALIGVDFRRARGIPKAIFPARMSGVLFQFSDLKGVQWKGKLLTASCNFRGASFSGVRTTCDSTFRDSIFERADLSAALFDFSKFLNCDLEDAKLTGTSLRYGELKKSNLQCADLRKADLTGVDFYGSDMRGADLRGAVLTNAKLSFKQYLEVITNESTVLPTEFTQ